MDLNGDGKSELVLQHAKVEFISGRDYQHVGDGHNNRTHHDLTLAVYDAQLQLRDSLLIEKENGITYGQLTVGPVELNHTRQIVFITSKVRSYRYGSSAAP